MFRVAQASARSMSRPLASSSQVVLKQCPHTGVNLPLAHHPPLTRTLRLSPDRRTVATWFDKWWNKGPGGPTKWQTKEDASLKEDAFSKEDESLKQALKEALKEALKKYASQEQDDQWWRTYKGRRDKNQWEFDLEATASMKDLLEQEPKKLSVTDGEVLVFRLPGRFLATDLSKFSLSNPSGSPWSLQPLEELLMVPSAKARLFQSLVRLRVSSSLAFRQLFIGTPGIGKSFSSALLIRSLMEAQTPLILYETQKAPRRYLIALKDQNNPNDGYEVFSITGEHYAGGGVEQLRNPHSWYVVDSGGEAAPKPIALQCKQVCVSSPDEGNYKEWAKGVANTRIISTPTDDEVRAMVKHYIDECAIISGGAPFPDLEREERLLRLKEEAWNVAQIRILVAGPVMRRIMQQDTFSKT